MVMPGGGSKEAANMSPHSGMQSSSPMGPKTPQSPGLRGPGTPLSPQWPGHQPPADQPQQSPTQNGPQGMPRYSQGGGFQQHPGMPPHGHPGYGYGPGGPGQGMRMPGPGQGMR